MGDQIASEYDLMDQPYAAVPGTPSITSGGTLPAGTYSIRAAYTYSGGVGIVSPSVMVTVSSGQQLSVPSPPADAAGLATGWNVYIGPSGNENLQNGTAIRDRHRVYVERGTVNNAGNYSTGLLSFLSSALSVSVLGRTELFRRERWYRAPPMEPDELNLDK